MSMIDSGLSLGLLNTALLAGKVSHAYYLEGHQQFYPLVVSLIASPLFRLLLMVQASQLATLSFRCILWLLFGGLSTSEKSLLREAHWPMLTEFASSYIIFQSLLSPLGWAHLALMYYTMLVTMLLEKRIEELHRAERAQEEEQDLMVGNPNENPPQGVSQWAHLRITTTITLLYLLNGLAIRYQLSRWYFPASGRFSLLTSLTLHRYLTSSVLLARCIAVYCLNLHEAATYPPPGQWDTKVVFEAALRALSTGLLAASNLGLVLLAWMYHVRAISLARMAVRNVRRFMWTVAELRSAVRATERLATYASPTAEEVASTGVCAICLDALVVEGENRKISTCSHIFHLRCLKQWAQRRQSCPSCRAPL